MLKTISLIFLLFTFSSEAFDLIAFKNKQYIYFIIDHRNSTSYEKELPVKFIVGSCEILANICPTVLDKNNKKINILSALMNFDSSHSDVLKIRSWNVYGSKIDLDWIKKWFKLEPGEYKINFRYMDWKNNKYTDSNYVAFNIE